MLRSSPLSWEDISLDIPLSNSLNDDYDVYVQIKAGISSQLDLYDPNDQSETLQSSDGFLEPSIQKDVEKATEGSNLDELEEILTNWLNESDIQNTQQNTHEKNIAETPKIIESTKSDCTKNTEKEIKKSPASDKPKKPVFKVYNRQELEALVAETKGPLKVTIFKCKECTFETKHKNCFLEHMIRHKDPKEVKTYKCEKCKYETKFPRYLKDHMTVHISVAEENMFKCSNCNYKAKSKALLKKHVVHHRSLSEIKMLKCKSCNYQTRFNANLNRHKLNHKDKSEIKLHKCPLCDFETKTSTNLKQHILTHKKKTKEQMYKCDVCHFETKLKKNLKQHMSTHDDEDVDDDEKTQQHKCRICSFESKTYKNFQIHLLTHKECSELKTYWSKTEL